MSAGRPADLVGGLGRLGGDEDQAEEEPDHPAPRQPHRVHLPQREFFIDVRIHFIIVMIR